VQVKTNFLPEEDIIALIENLAGAVGDELTAGLRKLGIDEHYSDSKKFLKWDLFNLSCVTKFNKGNMVARYARRGGWIMVPLVDFRTGFIFSVMREDRFKQLSRDKTKRDKLHYIDAFVHSFNFDIASAHQMNFINPNQFEEEQVANIVNCILKDMQIEKDMINRYAVILFEEFNHEITSIKCCIINSELNIVEEEDWSHYISHREPLVTEQISQNENPSLKQSLSLSEKAEKKIRQRKNVVEKDKEEEKRNNL
jgi:hypothetical protein